MRDAVATMGSILTHQKDCPPGKRDAVHVAVIAVTAGDNLAPGEDVSVLEQHGDYIANGMPNHVGIVDPFLKDVVKKGERFWLYLYPRTITGLNHAWTHPAFPEKPSKFAGDAERNRSYDWIKEYAGTIGIGAEDLIDGAKDYIATGEGLYLGDREEYLDEAFWDHYERVTGMRVAEDDRGSFFRCAC